MKIGVTGSRSIKDYITISNYLNRILRNLEGYTIVTGGHTAVDKLVKNYALQNNIPFEEITPNWEKFKGEAFYQRNLKLIDCDKIVVFWDGVSPGTAQLIHLCERYNVDHRVKNMK